ncbi:hypothetical protein Btru_075984 [Bulinus truncatus]|nr:hypothetical protein Btru_075984 [Bulinus truncatus]
MSAQPYEWSHQRVHNHTNGRTSECTTIRMVAPTSAQPYERPHQRVHNHTNGRTNECTIIRMAATTSAQPYEWSHQRVHNHMNGRTNECTTIRKAAQTSAQPYEWPTLVKQNERILKIKWKSNKKKVGSVISPLDQGPLKRGPGTLICIAQSSKMPLRELCLILICTVYISFKEKDTVGSGNDPAVDGKMSSNPVSSFFTRFRRDKSKERRDPKKRLSMPVMSSSGDISSGSSQHWTSESSPSSSSGALKSSENKAKSPKKDRQQKKTSEPAEKENNPQSKKGNGLSFLLCMSRNADTIDRQNVTGLPPHPNKSNKHKGKGRNSNESKEDVEAINKENKKTPKNKQPVKGWFSVDNIVPPDFLVNSDEPAKNNIYGPLYQPTRGPSQGVRYRVDGTLEKPYVFPSGFTFGPDGRKLKLRKSAPDYKSNKSKSELKLEHVHVDVHMPTSNSDEFDTDDAFYHKFDSSRQNSSRRNTNRYSMPEVPEDFFSPRDSFMKRTEKLRTESQQKELSSNNKLNNEHSSKKANDSDVRSSKRNRYKKNRYSMPPKNDEFVYMGSFENLHLCDSLEKRQNVENEKLSMDEMKKEKKRNRYSMPPKNAECIYMGSFENINFQCTGDKGSNVLLSLPKKDASLSRSYSSSASSQKYDKDSDVIRPRSEMVSFNKKPAGRPEVTITETPVSNFRKQRSSHPEAEDAFDDNLLGTQNSRLANPFSRNAVRSSCMPGNTRNATPPPAVFVTSAVSATDPAQHGTINVSGESSDQSAGSKSFKLPPPPNHTPSWEEMEKVQVRLSEMARGCHKGSQADISFDAESINMEDRDVSLSRAHVKRLGSAAGSQPLQHPSSISQNSKSNKDNITSKANSSNKEIIYDVPKPVITLHKQASLATKQPVQEMNNSQSSEDSVFESPIKVGSSNKPNLIVTSESRNSKNPYSNVKLINPELENSDTKNPVPNNRRSRHDYEYMYLCSTPHISTATDNLQVNPAISGANFANIEHGNILISPQTSSEDIAAAAKRHAVVTSTPKVVRKPTLTAADAELKPAVAMRPVPSPRKRSGNRDSVVNVDTSLAFVTNVDTGTSGDGSSQLTSAAAPTHQTRTTPVPKKRTNLSHSSSACSASEVEKKFKVFTCEDKKLIDQPKKNSLKHTASNSKTDKNVDTVDNTKHIYEDVVLNKISSSTSQAVVNGHHYEVCGSLTSSGLGETDYFYISTDMRPSPRNESAVAALLPLSPINTMKLTSSPLSKRRSEVLPLSNRPIYTGLSTSATDLVDLISPSDHHDYSNWMWPGLRLDDDENCVADDELSLCNDDEDVHRHSNVVRVKRGSLRKWASADDVLRSGSIVDRSMILAKKRKLRKRQKKSLPVTTSLIPPQKLQQQTAAGHQVSTTENQHAAAGKNQYMKNRISALAAPRATRYTSGEHHV